MKWFRQVFLPSFGYCDNLHISKRQADIFMRYLNLEKVTRTYTKYFSKLDGKKICFERISPYFGSYSIYVITIKADNTEIIEKLKSKREKLNALFNEEFDAGATIERLDWIEEQIQLIDDEIDKLF